MEKQLLQSCIGIEFENKTIIGTQNSSCTTYSIENKVRLVIIFIRLYFFLWIYSQKMEKIKMIYVLINM